MWSGPAGARVYSKAMAPGLKSIRAVGVGCQMMSERLPKNLPKECRTVPGGSSHAQMSVTIAHNYFALTRTPNLLDAFSGTNSISDALKRIGIDDFRRRWTRIDARLPTQQEAELLQMSKAKPVFESESLDTFDDAPIKYGHNISCAERITIMVDFDDISDQR